MPSLAAAARAQGLRVETELSGRMDRALVEAAQARGAARIVSSCDGERCWLVEGEHTREVTLAALLEEASTWSR